LLKAFYKYYYDDSKNIDYLLSAGGVMIRPQVGYWLAGKSALEQLI
jgi:hypothetical protein